MDRSIAGLAVIVLAGGESRRFGSDKLVARLDDRTLLEHALDGIPVGTPIAVVGPERPLSRAVVFLREDPPGGGPAAGLMAGLRWALDQHAAMIATLPGDAPAGGRAAMQLVAVLADADAGLGRRSPSADGERSADAGPDHRFPSADGFRGLARGSDPRSPSNDGKRSTNISQGDPSNPDALVAVDADQREQVLQLAMRPSVARALIEVAGPAAGHGASVRRLLHRLDPAPQPVELPGHLTADIDSTAQLSDFRNQNRA